MSASFIPDSYPHLMDRILLLLDYPDLLTLRLVNSSLRSMADRELTRGTLLLYSSNGVTVAATRRGCLPSFCPGSSLPPRLPILSSKIALDGAVPSTRVNKVLRSLPPDCHLVVRHKGTDAGFNLPDASILQVVLDVPCDCAHRSKAFQHAARVVLVDLVVKTSNNKGSICQIAAGLLSPSVHTLAISADEKRTIFETFGWVKGFKGFRRSEHHPDLCIVAIISDIPFGQYSASVSQELAAVFDTDIHHVIATGPKALAGTDSSESEHDPEGSQEEDNSDDEVEDDAEDDTDSSENLQSSATESGISS
ncbi:hypothetical protein A1Q1_04783 [Trichosporon asahii var. asahii CBS 2479]|uniref:F-box domain-containing protein n=1 Tax=Trichosporon asahii var. asahii (strain ATCC 90039 / CBS 2479 / JCM 2466 / KCTC 7840 / NBRC 103889/ NCYC 2677 / UAMH 7654) TaxID=1186058 RepID=J5SNE4_TRIAS|nr:hypothetical protein A1Q1_04783 [Trichosporon asahii var. asahii CBS 2479]EJT46606.1 hypothetical protein A1Q1_04783 [Trichosporon asahii var. asahii CBS 2479]